MNSYPQSEKNKTEEAVGIVYETNEKPKKKKEKPKNVQAERLLKVFEEYDLKQNDFSIETGIANSTLNTSIHRSKTINPVILQAVAKKFGMSTLYYVMFGEEMTIDNLQSSEVREKPESYSKKDDLIRIESKIDKILNHLKIDTV